MDTLTLHELQVLIEVELADHCGEDHTVRYGTLVDLESKLMRNRRLIVV